MFKDCKSRLAISGNLDRNSSLTRKMRRHRRRRRRRQGIWLVMVERATALHIAPKPQRLGTLILLRHGESVWNVPEDERYTGWTDIPLTKRGEEEARLAGLTLAKRGVFVDKAFTFTSVLQRASRTLELALANCASSNVEVYQDWRLNERHYGALQGLNKERSIETFGADRVREWRRSWEVRPPLMEPSHPLYPEIYTDPKYKDLPAELLPRGESVADTAARLEPYWFSDIAPAVRSGHSTIVCAHANSLRALLRIIFRRQVTDDQIRQVKIPTGVPLIYRLEEVPFAGDDLLCDVDAAPVLCDGLSEQPDYDLIPGRPPPECADLEGEMLWPLEECPLIWDDWNLGDNDDLSQSPPRTRSVTPRRTTPPLK